MTRASRDGGMGLAGKSALVTGAGSGIGKAAALAFADQGCAVLCADIGADTAAVTAGEVVASGGVASAYHCDVTQADDVRGVVAAAESAHDGLDILFNGAGVMRSQPLLDTTVESFQALLAVNLLGLFSVLQASARSMMERGRGGRIINVASIAGRRGNPGSIQYCASKAAVISVTQSAALALIPHGITVNAIAPGYIQTHMWTEIHRQFAEPQGVTPDAFDAQLASTVAAGRLGTPADLIGSILFLASDAATYIVGQTLNIDGGVEFN